MSDHQTTTTGPAEELWRCPVHGVLEPHKLSRGWGTGEPGEYGTCPVMLDEDTGCGEVLERPPIVLAPLPDSTSIEPEGRKLLVELTREEIQHLLARCTESTNAPKVNGYSCEVCRGIGKKLEAALVSPAASLAREAIEAHPHYVKRNEGDRG